MQVREGNRDWLFGLKRTSGRRVGRKSHQEKGYHGQVVVEETCCENVPQVCVSPVGVGSFYRQVVFQAWEHQLQKIHSKSDSCHYLDVIRIKAVKISVYLPKTTNANVRWEGGRGGRWAGNTWDVRTLATSGAVMNILNTHPRVEGTERADWLRLSGSSILSSVEVTLSDSMLWSGRNKFTGRSQMHHVNTTAGSLSSFDRTHSSTNFYAATPRNRRREITRPQTQNDLRMVCSVNATRVRLTLRQFGLKRLHAS